MAARLLGPNTIGSVPGTTGDGGPNRDSNPVTLLWEQPLEGGKPKQLTTFTDGQIFGFSWTLDRKELLLTRGNTTSDIVLMSNFR